jgi:hypothetical protein
MQVALWLVLKQANSKKQLALPLSIFGLHLFLGNWWNGEHIMTDSTAHCALVLELATACVDAWHNITPSTTGSLLLRACARILIH